MLNAINFDFRFRVQKLANIFNLYLLLCKVIFLQTTEVSKLRGLLPAAKSFPLSDEPLLLITRGPGQGTDLATVGGTTPQIIGRNACKLLWTKEELMSHMLSPKVKQKQGVPTRTDFSPARKNLLKSNFS